MDVNEFVRALERFKEEVDSEIQIQTMLAFLAVARRGVCTQKEIETELGMTIGSASRNISYWTDLKKPGVEGIGFIERVDDPRDRRYKLLRLTDTGKAFYTALRKATPNKGR